MKKFLSMITSAVILICAVYTAPMSAGAEDALTITTAKELKAFADSVNGGNTYEGQTVTLANDIDLSTVCGKDVNGEEISWTPIGDGTASFDGTFNGGGNTISGLYIHADGSDLGLFGLCGEGSQILNLIVDGSVTMSCAAVPPTVAGIANCSEGKIVNCHNKTDIMGLGSVFAGGICVRGKELKNCINTGVISSESRTAAIAAWGADNIDNCYYLEGTAENGNGTTAKTAEQFASGEVAYLLGEPWGQRISVDEYPVIGGDKVYLVDGKYTNVPYDDMPHTHRICADADCADNHEVKTWTAWESADKLPEEAGYYYLTNDIITESGVNVVDGVYICLNGHIIQGVGKGTVTLTATPACDNCGITDCTDTIHNFSAREDGLWTLDEENGDIPIEGGTIIGSMLIASDIMFEMYNINAVGDDGAGIFLYSRGDVLLEDCMLAGNNGSHALNVISPVELRDCIIFANTCDSAVRVSNEFKIGGRITIDANMNADGKSCNLELREGRTVTIAEPLRKGSYICVSTEAVPTIGNPISVTGANGEDCSAYFHSDNYHYMIVNGENNVVQLTEVNPKTYPYTINSLKLFSEDGEVYDEIPIGTGFIVDMEVTKVAERGRPDPDYFIVAAYDENGALVSMNYIKAGLSTGVSFPCEVNIQKSDTPIAKIKAFVWDGLGSMTPLAKAYINTK